MTYEFGAAGARAPELLRTALAGPDRHRLQRRGAAPSRPVFQADRRAHRRLRRLRHPRHRAGLDPSNGQWRRHPADRRLCRAVHGQGRPRGLSSPVPVPAHLQGQALGLLRRRRRVRALLSHDIFGDPALQQAYKSKFNRDLRVPQTWDEYAEVAQFITDQLAPNVYGAAHFRKAGSPGNQFSFLQQYRANGGRFFDEQTMKAQLDSEAGLKTFQQMIAANDRVDPGQQRHGRRRRVGGMAARQGRDAHLVAADRAHERELCAARQGDHLRARVRRSWQGGLRRRAGRQSPACVRLRQGAGAGSSNEEAAYLFMQWSTSPAVSLARVMAPFALRDPYRMSHYTSPLYRSLWPDAKDYLINLSNSANGAVLDMIMPGWQDYALSIDRMCTAVWAGEDPQTALAESGCGVGCHDGEARRRQPTRGLSAVRQAAWRLCRQHHREDGPRGAYHLTWAASPPSPCRGCRARHTSRHPRFAPAAGLSLELTGSGQSDGGWRRRERCRCQAYRRAAQRHLHGLIGTSHGCSPPRRCS